MSLQRRKIIKPKQLQEICLTPLIDTALTLLVIFMVATPMMHNGLNIDLPKSQTNENQPNNEMLTVYLEKSNGDELGNIFVNETQVDIKNLVALLQEKIGTSKHQTINLNADQSLAYKVIVDVVDKIKFVSGVDHVVLSTARAS